MARSFYYLIDGLTAERGQRLTRALEELPEVKGVAVRPDHGVVEIQATRDPETQLKMACSIVGTTFRVKVKRRSL